MRVRLLLMPDLNAGAGKRTGKPAWQVNNAAHFQDNTSRQVN